MTEYRWNITEFAVGYDAAATHIHPFYEVIHERILHLLEAAGAEGLLVDAGGGSGRFVERFLRHFDKSRAILVDQSESFLALAEQRLRPMADRVELKLAKLQDDWFSATDPPAAIVSMSAIHHLDPAEKREFYARCLRCLKPGGVLINGDEVRPPSDAAYLAQCRKWATHMQRVMRDGLVPEPMFEALRQWEQRNVDNFGQPRRSGDDCHETIEIQCDYLRAAGFASVDVPWQEDLWAILHATKSE